MGLVLRGEFAVAFAGMKHRRDVFVARSSRLSGPVRAACSGEYRPRVAGVHPTRAVSTQYIPFFVLFFTRNNPCPSHALIYLRHFNELSQDSAIEHARALGMSDELIVRAMICACFKHPLHCTAILRRMCLGCPCASSVVTECFDSETSVCLVILFA